MTAAGFRSGRGDGMGYTIADIRQMEDDWLSTEIVASALKMNQDRLRGYLKSGKLKVTTRPSGKRITVSRTSLLDWYDGKKTIEELLERLIELEAERNDLIRELINRRLTA